jgi:hypothetical protein
MMMTMKLGTALYQVSNKVEERVGCHGMARYEMLCKGKSDLCQIYGLIMME